MQKYNTVYSKYLTKTHTTQNIHYQIKLKWLNQEINQEWMKIPQNTYCVFTLSIVARQIIFSFPAYLYNLNNKINSLNNALMSSFHFMDSIVHYIKCYGFTWQILWLRTLIFFYVCIHSSLSSTILWACHNLDYTLRNAMNYRLFVPKAFHSQELSFPGTVVPKIDFSLHLSFSW